MNANTSVQTLISRKGVKVSMTNSSITINKTDHEAGIGSWGHIDYLVNYCGFSVVFV
jgi:hypothetical protein